MIRMPRLEYKLDSDNFLFIKTLSQEQTTEFLDSLFHNWQELAMEQLQSIPDFNRALLDIQSTLKAGQSVKGKYSLTPSDLKLMDTQTRNYRLSNLAQQHERDKAFNDHSKVPGQCSHSKQEIQKDKAVEDVESEAGSSVSTVKLG